MRTKTDAGLSAPVLVTVLTVAVAMSSRLVKRSLSSSCETFGAFHSWATAR